MTEIKEDVCTWRATLAQSTKLEDFKAAYKKHFSKGGKFSPSRNNKPILKLDTDFDDWYVIQMLLWILSDDSRTDPTDAYFIPKFVELGNHLKLKNDLPCKFELWDTLVNTFFGKLYVD